MSSKHWSLLLLLTVFGYLACQKEYRPGFPVEPTDPFGKKINTTISGRVMNERNEPVEGAAVTAGNGHATTNYNGYFNIENTTVPADAAFIKVVMQGYFLGSRTISAQENGAHFVQVELIPVKKSGEFESGAGGSVSFPSGGSAIFPANAIVRQLDGSPYSGRVNVSQFFIDPTTKGFTDRMPGDLKGITVGNELRALQSFGMMAIQLNGEGGELLQVAQGKKADLHFPIPTGLSAIAPSTIPLWYFDEEKGLWREEGSAVKNGNEYIGQVSHFSFWNVDVPLEFTEIIIQLKDQAANPQANVRVEIKKKSDNTVAAGFTDAEGRVQGWIPSGEALELSVYNACNTLMHKRDIGPYSLPTDLGVLIIEAGTSTSFILNNLTAINCYEQNISNGYINYYFGGRNFRVPLEGGPGVSLGFSHCSDQPDSARITVYDADQDMYVVKSIWVKSGINDVGLIRICNGELGQFLKIKIDGNRHEFLSPVDSLLMARIGTDHVIYGFRIAGNGAGTIRFPSYIEAPYSTSLVDLSVTSDSVDYASRSNGNVNIQKFGAVNEFIEGTFFGQVTDSISGQTNIPMTGSFRVKRLW
jgi:hypothetical protein